MGATEHAEEVKQVGEISHYLAPSFFKFFSKDKVNKEGPTFPRTTCLRLCSEENIASRKHLFLELTPLPQIMTQSYYGS